MFSRLPDHFNLFYPVQRTSCGLLNDLKWIGQ
jgi:hypothetical protein